MTTGPAQLRQDEFPESSGETADLRTRPIYKAPAFHLAYCRPSDAPKVTGGLEPGTQAKFIAAAARAADLGHPLNTLLTVRWVSLFSDGDVHPLRAMPPPQRIRHLVELFRKWLTRRDLPAVYIWVRETAQPVGEHWHLGLHLPSDLRQPFVNYVGDVLGEPRAPCPRPASQRTEGEFACGALASWHLAGDIRPERGGYFLAAYLGKGEPSRRLFRGQLVNNTRKPVRGREFGGTYRGNRYDVEQGHIKGTTTRKGRFDIARFLK